MPDVQSRVLIVDDDPVSVRLLEAILISDGIAALSTADPRHAVQLVKSFQPDLVLLDLYMPVMDGFQVLQRLRTVIRASDFLPVMVLTADASAASRERALAAGADDFLSKPFELNDIHLRVRNLLRARSRHVALQERIAELEQQVERESRQRHQQRRHAEKHTARIRAVLDGDVLQMHYQPIVGLRDGELRGVEALARFSAKPARSPHRWFAEAAQVGLGVELEVFALRAAVRGLVQLPADSYLSVNMSPDAVRAPLGQRALAAVPPGRVVLELTALARPAEQQELADALAAVRAGGVRLAVDDAGTGSVTLRHLLRLSPDILKIGLALTRGIDTDVAQRALAAALVDSAGRIGASVVAEGIETQAELEVLRELGVAAGQGYLLGRPQPLPALHPFGGTAPGRPRR